MAQTDIDLSAFQRLEDSLRLMPEIMQEEFTTAMQASVDLLHAQVTTEPAQVSKTRASVYGTPFKSDRQRRWLFAALKRGLVVPYQRTGELIARWVKVVEVVTNGVAGRVFTQSPVAKWVQGDEQSLMLAHWRKARAIAEESKPEIYDNFREAITRGVQRMRR